MRRIYTIIVINNGFGKVYRIHICIYCLRASIVFLNLYIYVYKYLHHRAQIERERERVKINKKVEVMIIKSFEII